MRSKTLQIYFTVVGHKGCTYVNIYIVDGFVVTTKMHLCKQSSFGYLKATNNMEHVYE